MPPSVHYLYPIINSFSVSVKRSSQIAVYDMEGRGLVLMPANNYYVEETTELQADWYQQALDGKGSAVIGLYTSTDYMGNAIADPQLLVARSIVRAEQMKSIGIMTVTVDLGDLERVFSEQFAQPLSVSTTPEAFQNHRSLPGHLPSFLHRSPPVSA